MPDVPDLVEKIVARLQVVVETGPSLILDAQGYLYSSGQRDLALPVLEEMVRAFDASTDLDEAMVATLICRITGAEDAILFSGPRQAEMAIYRTFGANRNRILIARRDLRETEDGVRTESLLRNMGVAFTELGCADKVQTEDYLGAISRRTGLVRLAMDYTGRDSGLDARGVKAIQEALDGLDVKVPLHLHLDYASLIPLDGLLSRPIPMLGKILDSGFDLVSCSTGQLIGGPACGLILGRKGPLEKIRHCGSELLFPAHYADLAGVYRTFSLSQNSEEASLKIPILQKVNTSMANLRNRGARLLGQLQELPVVEQVSIMDGESKLARDATGITIPTCLLRLVPSRKTAEQFAASLAKGPPSLLTQVDGGALLLDLRTLSPKCDSLVVDLLAGLTPPAPV